MTRPGLLALAAAAAVGAVAPVAAGAFSNVAVGDRLEDAELRTLDGAKARLLRKGAAANVFVFFRPEQERSLDTLKLLAGCEREFAAKPVHWVAIVSDSWAAPEVKATIDAAGTRMPVLVDAGDALYGKLGVRLHPAIGIVDAQGRLAAYEPFREINYCDRVRARIQLLLGEITAADVAKVDEPERATTRTDDGVARRHLNFARNLFRIRQLEGALAEVEKSLAIVRGADGLALQGQILAAMGRCPDAMRAFELALALQPGHAAALDGRKACGP